MKKLIFIGLLLLCGCGDNPIFTDRVNIPYSKFSIVQEYGFCDSVVCVGQAIILKMDSLQSNYAGSVITGDSILCFGGDTIPHKRFLLQYNTDKTLNFDSYGNGMTIYGNGMIEINYPFNSNVPIKIF